MCLKEFLFLWALFLEQDQLPLKTGPDLAAWSGSNGSTEINRKMILAQGAPEQAMSCSSMKSGQKSKCSRGLLEDGDNVLKSGHSINVA